MSEAAIRESQRFNAEGISHAQQGRLEQAASCFRQVVRLRPDDADGYCNLGNILSFQGRLDEAVAAYQEGLRLRPKDAAALSNLSNTLRLMGRVEEAAAMARQALAHQPGYARAHNNLGAALLLQNRLDDAALCFRQALVLQPGLAEAHTNLGATLRRQKRPEEAVACCRNALRLGPNLADAHSCLGAALADLGQLDAALPSLREALRLNPALASAHVNLGSLRTQQGRLDEALASYHEALRLEANNPEAHLFRAMIRLLQGDFAQGWPEYEWRWRNPVLVGQRVPEPLWDGAPLTGRPLVLHAEQGWGDTFQFVRYGALVKRLADVVMLLCPQAAIPLLGGCPGIDRFLSSHDALPSDAVHAPLLSLPRVLGTTLQTIPAPVPYLAADPGLVEHWRRELSACTGFKIGVVWQGSPANNNDRNRSVPLPFFEPIARTPGVWLVSLQIGKGSEALRATGRFDVMDLADRLDRTTGAFMDTAAVMKNLDLVIACDTAAAHLAGALGVPVWVALPFAPDWRWLLERDDSPWYPTMRLFRQRERGGWAEVFARMAQALRPLLPAG